MPAAGIHSPTLLSYSHSKERTDERGGLDHKNVVEMDVQYVISRNQRINRKHLRSLIGKWISLNLGNFSYDLTTTQNPSGSKWKVTKVEFPTSDGFEDSLIHLGKYVISYTRVEDANYSYFLDNADNADLKDGLLVGKEEHSGENLKYIEEFSDSFGFNRESDGTYKYDHSVDVKFTDTHNIPTGSGSESEKPESPIALAKKLAQLILNNHADNTFDGFLGAKFLHGGSTASKWNSDDVKKYFTEKYDLINNNCSFSKSFSSSPNINDDYQYKLTHEFSYNDKGIITIKESGEVQGIKVGDEINQGKEGVEDLLEGSWARCNVVFSNYRSKVDTTAVASLKNEPLSISKDFVDGSASASYSTEFSNNIKNINGILIERTIGVDRDVNGFFTIKENGTANRMQKTKDKNFGKSTGYKTSPAYELLSVATASYGSRMVEARKDAMTRAGHGAYSAPTLWPTARTYSFFNQGKSATYSISASDNWKDGTWYVGAGASQQTLTNIEITVNDTLPIPMHQSYPILGWKELVHDAGQTELGKRAVSIKAIRRRKNGQNIITSPVWPTELINYMFLGFGKPRLWEIIKDLPVSWSCLYLSSADCSFNSKGDLNLKCDIDYVSERADPSRGATPEIGIFG